MYKPLPLLSISALSVSGLLLPALGLSLLAAGNYLVPRGVPLSLPAAETTQRKPAWANSNRVAVLRQQYKCYQRNRQRPALARQAADGYNQCVEESDPSALIGTGLPPRLP